MDGELRGTGVGERKELWRDVQQSEEKNGRGACKQVVIERPRDNDSIFPFKHQGPFSLLVKVHSISSSLMTTVLYSVGSSISPCLLLQPFLLSIVHFLSHTSLLFFSFSL